jgi:hypothetical protein
MVSGRSALLALVVASLFACRPAPPLVPTPEDDACLAGEQLCGDIDPGVTVGCCMGDSFCCGPYGYPGMCCNAGEEPEDGGALNTPQIRRAKR